MNWRIVVAPEARLELAEAADWYDVRSSDVASEFLRTFETVYDAILHNPRQYQLVWNNVRRAPFRKFPYSLVYTVGEDTVVIVACFHSKRNPRRWQDRIVDEA